MSVDKLGTEEPRSASENVAIAVRVLMQAQRRQSREVANHLGLSRQRLSERLNGHSKFTIEEVADLAGFFGVDVGVLFLNPEELVRSRWLSEPAGQPVQGRLRFLHPVR